ncbi:cytochrome b/b6 domain-containing protein [Halodesulfurarchaeum sp. HSR-GB]|uniref:cytochrome b/b6 domain-containing protein n=1 Tax=Halodesulfurarchaeum sp. HSR-GB TaxID=3074077 RepID=UPI00285CB8FE|nr:cytochrome b/b6 domain-containing protein [Halodesulfurarchaeum sp. HSR-GB]MDR5656655.1 cytochrome b/b6 domain-containing protein [Halodesulfurarchaeum sp. HSR-GB]
MSGSEEISRFSAVQVYVHFLMAAAILVLFLTGVAITFGGQVGWIVSLLGNESIILIHIIAGVALFVTLLYYLIFALTGLATGDFPTKWLPGPSTIRELITYVNYHILGRGPEPRPGKYTWIQKSEVLIIAVELTVLTATGLVLMFPGLLLRYRPAFLVASDLHVVFAFTLLMGVTFHLYDTHLLQFPLDTSIFTGRVSLDRAREEWAGWVDAGQTRSDGGSGDRFIQVLGVFAVLFVFAVVYSGVLIDRILAPIPGTQETLYLLERPETILEGPAGIFWTVGFNLVVIVILVGLVALLYGITLRFGD